VVLSLIRANVRSGLRPGADSSTALATYSGARIAYLRAQSEYAQVRSQIESYTGENLGDDRPDTLVVNRESIDRLANCRRGDTLNPGHPLLTVYARRIDAQLALNAADEKRFLPKLALTGAYWERNTGVSAGGAFARGVAMPYGAFNYLFGLSATVGVSDLWLRHEHRVSNRYLTDAAKYAWQQEQLELGTLAGQARISLTATLAQLDEIPVQQQAAQSSYLQQLALYRAGLNTLTDVTNAEYTLLQSETNLVVTQAEALKLEYLLAALGGNQDLFTEQFKR
jgi:outer membrane protein TolC